MKRIVSLMVLLSGFSTFKASLDDLDNCLELEKSKEEQSSDQVGLGLIASLSGRSPLQIGNIAPIFLKQPVQPKVTTRSFSPTLLEVEKNERCEERDARLKRKLTSFVKTLQQDGSVVEAINEAELQGLHDKGCTRLSVFNRSGHINIFKINRNFYWLCLQEGISPDGSTDYIDFLGVTQCNELAQPCPLSETSSLNQVAEMIIASSRNEQDKGCFFDKTAQKKEEQERIHKAKTALGLCLVPEKFRTLESDHFTYVKKSTIVIEYKDGIPCYFSARTENNHKIDRSALKDNDSDTNFDDEEDEKMFEAARKREAEKKAARKAENQKRLAELAAAEKQAEQERAERKAKRQAEAERIKHNEPAPAQTTETEQPQRRTDKDVLALLRQRDKKR